MAIEFLRHESGSAAPPTALKPGQPSIDEVAEITYIGYGNNGLGQATSVVPFAGRGLFILKTLLGAALGAASLDANSKLPLAQLPTLVASLISDATAAGRALLMATTVAAQRTMLGIDNLRQVNNTNYAVVAGDYVVQFTAMTAPRTVQLLAASSYNPGTRVRVGDSSGQCSTTNTITTQAAGTDKINGAATQTTGMAYGQLDMISDGVGAWTLMASSAAVTSSSTDDGTY